MKESSDGTRTCVQYPQVIEIIAACSSRLFCQISVTPSQKRVRLPDFFWSLSPKNDHEIGVGLGMSPDTGSVSLNAQQQNKEKNKIIKHILVR